MEPPGPNSRMAMVVSADTADVDAANAARRGSSGPRPPTECGMMLPMLACCQEITAASSIAADAVAGAVLPRPYAYGSGKLPLVLARWSQATCLSAIDRVETLDELLQREGQRSITAYCEYRHLFPAAQWIDLDPPFGLFHCFVLLELDGGVLYLCLEKFQDALEVMLLHGENEVVHQQVTMLRATGEGRELSPLRPVLMHGRWELGKQGSPLVTIADLRRWIQGPLAAQWRPFNQIVANCQHFAQDLVMFLRCPLSCAGFESVQRGREGLLSALRHNGSLLEGAPPDMRRDRQLVLAAVRQSGLALRFAVEELQADPDVVLAAVRRDGFAMQYAAEALRHDREFGLQAVRMNGGALRHLSDKLRQDHDVVLAAVRCCPAALEFAAEERQQEREVVLVAVQLDGLALRFASEALRQEREVVRAAVVQHGAALAHAPEKLRRDSDLVAAAVGSHGVALQFAAQELRASKQLASIAVDRHGMALEFVSEDLRADRDVVMAAVARCGAALQFAAGTLKRDRDVVLTAVRSDGYALAFAALELQQDPEVLRARMW